MPRRNSTPSGGFFDYEKLEARIKVLENETTAPDFWSNPDKKNSVMQELKSLRGQTGVYKELAEAQKDLEGFLAIVSDNDEESLKHLEEEFEKHSKKLDQLEFQKLLSGPADRNSAILNINAGAGGTEACDWASMLLRMYSRWAEEQKYRVSVIDVLSGEEANKERHDPD